MKTKLSDEWQTPMWLFNKLNEEFNFVIDLCTSGNLEDDPGNSKVRDMWLGVQDDYLKTDIKSLMGGWEDRAAFINPPYSNPKPFIEKAWEDSKHCKIVCLVKLDASTKWWATFWEYEKEVYNCPKCYEQYEGRYLSHTQQSAQSCFPCSCGYLVVLERKIYTGPKPGCDYRLFPKRIKFDPPQQLIDSGEVWQLCKPCDNKDHNPIHKYCWSNLKWAKKCVTCNNGGCVWCKGRGYQTLSGPTFSSALIIMDRRGL